MRCSAPPSRRTAPPKVAGPTFDATSRVIRCVTPKPVDRALVALESGPQADMLASIPSLDRAPAAPGTRAALGARRFRRRPRSSTEGIGTTAWTSRGRGSTIPLGTCRLRVIDPAGNPSIPIEVCFDPQSGELCSLDAALSRFELAAGPADPSAQTEDRTRGAVEGVLGAAARSRRAMCTRDATTRRCPGREEWCGESASKRDCAHGVAQLLASAFRTASDLHKCAHQASHRCQLFRTSCGLLADWLRTDNPPRWAHSGFLKLQDSCALSSSNGTTRMRSASGTTLRARATSGISSSAVSTP